MLLLRSNGTLLHMKDCIITFVKLIISKKHNFILYNALTNTELSVSVYHAFSPQKSMAKNKNVPGALVRMFFQRFQSEFLRTEYPPA